MIDVRKVKALGKLLLKLETRSRTGSNRKLFFIYITYLIPGLVIPWLLTRQVTDPTGFEFAFVSYLMYSITVVFTIINELDNIIISKSEAELFSSMPIDNRLIVSGKMYMMLRYFSFLCIPLLLPGSIYFYAVSLSFVRSLLYIISGYMLILFTANIITLLYIAAVKFLKAQKTGSLSLIFQLVMIFVLLVCYQLVSYGVSGRMGSQVSGYITMLESYGLLNIFPQAWYALLPSKYNYEAGIVLILKILLPIFICQMSYLSVKWYFEANYNLIREKYLYARIVMKSDGQVKGFAPFRLAGDFIRNVYLRNNTERASYGFMKSLSKRDKTVRLNIIPMIIIPAALALFAAVTNQLPFPFGEDVLFTKPVFHISILLCVLVVLNTALLGVKITNFPGAAWIYEAYPLVRGKSFKNGIRKFFVIKLIMPMFIILFIIILSRIPFHFALIHIAFMLAVANLYNSLYSIFSKSMPFTKENSLINSLQRLTSIIVPVIIGVVFSIIMLVVYTRIEAAITAIVILFTLTFWINYFAFRRKAA